MSFSTHFLKTEIVEHNTHSDYSDALLLTEHRAAGQKETPGYPVPSSGAWTTKLKRKLLTLASAKPEDTLGTEGVLISDQVSGVQISEASQLVRCSD